jgi:hypothetical protein
LLAIGNLVFFLDTVQYTATVAVIAIATDFFFEKKAVQNRPIFFLDCLPAREEVAGYFHCKLVEPRLSVFCTSRILLAGDWLAAP